MNRDEIIKILKAPEFSLEVHQKLLSSYSHYDLVKQPRVDFPKRLIKRDNPSSFKRDAFLTGGSVAAVILEKLFNIPAVINDIDIFYYTYKANTDLDADQESKLEQYQNMTGPRYRILKSTEHKQLNFVKILQIDFFYWEALLDSFDLNCSKVGIVLETKELIFSNDFIDFLLTKIITVGNVDKSNFLTSIIRATLKAKDHRSRFFLGDFFREHAFSYFSSYDEGNNFIDITHKSEDRNTKCLVTKKRWSLLKRNPDLLKPYVEVVSEDAVNIIPPKESWFSFLRFLYRKNNNFSINFARDELQKQNEKFFTRIKSLIDSNIAKEPHEWTQFITVKDSFIFKKDFSQKDIGYIKSFLTNHNVFTHGFSSYLIKIGYSIQDVLDFYNFFKKQTNQNIGEMEACTYQVVKDLTQYKNNKYIDILKEKDWSTLIKTFEYERSQRKMVDTLTSAIHHPFTKFIKELITETSLQLEHVKMHHCVDGYGRKVKNGECKIFHIEYQGNMSTLEVSIRDGRLHFPKNSKKTKIHLTTNMIKKKTQNKKTYLKATYFCIVQHKGVCNQNPYKGNIRIAEALVTYLNQTIQSHKMTSSEKSFDSEIKMNQLLISSGF